MAILKIARLGHPVLRHPAGEIPADQIDSLELQRLIDDMIATMVDDAGIGLAAPQVFQPLRLVILGDPDAAAADDDALPLTVLINPTWERRFGEAEDGWEGCLSIPGLRGVVPRWPSVALRAQDRSGRLVRLEATGYLARVLQHEIDHLDGVLYLDRMPDMRQLAFTEEYSRYWSHPESDDDEYLE